MKNSVLAGVRVTRLLLLSSQLFAGREDVSPSRPLAVSPSQLVAAFRSVLLFFIISVNREDFYGLTFQRFNSF